MANWFQEQLPSLKKQKLTGEKAKSSSESKPRAHRKRCSQGAWSDPHNTQRTEMPILNDNNPQFSERNQLCCSYGNCLQFPPTTTPYSRRGKANQGTGSWSMPVPNGGKRQRGAAERGSPGRDPAQLPLPRHTGPRLPPGISLRPLPTAAGPASSEPSISPKSGTKHSSIPAQKRRRGGAWGRCGGKGRTRKTSEAANRESAAAGAAPNPGPPRTPAAQRPGAARAGEGRDGGTEGGRLPALRGTNSSPPPPPNRPPHSFACRRAVT